MHVEITRLITGWLEHPEFGINALLPTVSRKNLKGKSDPIPAKPTLYNDVDFNIVTVGGVDPPELPALVVSSDVDLRGDNVEQGKRPGIQVRAVTGIGYYTEETYRNENVRAGNYVMRAVLMSLKRYHESAQRSEAFRELNGVRIVNMTGLTMQQVAGAVPKSRLLGVVFADLLILDKAL